MSQQQAKSLNVTIKVSDKFRPLYELPPDVELVILMGGRGGGKTYEASKFVVKSVCVDEKRCQILRDEKGTIQESIMNEILLRYDTANVSGVFDRKFLRLSNGIKRKSNDEMVVFTKGFRASSLDKKANMKGVSNVDIGLIEEAEDIRDEDQYRTYSDSIRKEGSFIIIILNTPDIHHWVVKRYFNAIPVKLEDIPLAQREGWQENDIDGFFRLEPKGVRGVVCIQCNYYDNKYLPEKTVRQYEERGMRESPMFDPFYYMTSILGMSTTGLKGQVFKRWRMCSLEEYNELDYTEVFGVDFGTASPAGVVSVKICGNTIYIRELSYEPLPIHELAKRLDELGVGRSDLIIADCAEPDSIRTLRFGIKRYLSEADQERYPNATLGFRNCRPSPDKSIRAGLDQLLGMEIVVVEGSDNLLRELTMYVWATDRDGKPLDKPIDNYNHLIDPTRYIVRVHGHYF